MDRSPLHGDSEQDEELVGVEKEQRNWKGIIIALVVIATVFGLIITAIVLVTPKDLDALPSGRMEFHSLIDHEYQPKPFHPVWEKDETFVYRNADGAVVRYFCEDNDTAIVMDNSTFRMLDTRKYKISPDGRYVLLPYELNYQHKFTYLAKYKLYSIDTKVDQNLIGPTGQKHGHKPIYEETFQYVTWAPKGLSLAAVQNNNIFYLKNATDTNYQQLTFNGSQYEIYHGIPDWLYEEEILKSDNALWWCPDASCLVYATFDDRFIHRYEMAVYGPLRENYVETKRMPFPKAGTPNPTVELRVFNFEDNTTKQLHPPLLFQNTFRDYYLTRVTWKDNVHLLVTWLNRHHNLSIISLCNVKLGKCYDNYRVEADMGWLVMDSEIFIPPKGNAYYLILPQKDGEYGSFRHIAKIDVTTDDSNIYTSGSKMFVTSGRMEVQKIVGFDENAQIIYFLAVEQSDPRERHLYSTTTDVGAANFRIPACLSCDFSPDCLYVDTSFSPSGQYYILGCLGPSVPYYQVMKIPNILVRTLEQNDGLRHILDEVAMPKIKFMEIRAHSGRVLWVKLLIPPMVDEEEKAIKYNLVFNVNVIPDSQVVTHKFELGWDHFQSSQHGMVVGYVDPRGSGGRGDEWLYSIHKRLGTHEVEDILFAARRVKSSLSYIDEVSAIYGENHGGFLTTAVMGNKGNIFNCGIAISPITEWRYYDTFYTERFMGMPFDDRNVQKYDQANVSRNAGNFRKTRFMIMHGTADDTVHFQHSAQFIKALTAEDVYFRTQIYSDQRHTLTDGPVRSHLYNTMEDFLHTCFNKIPPREAEKQAKKGLVEEDDEE